MPPLSFLVPLLIPSQQVQLMEPRERMELHGLGANGPADTTHAVRLF